MKISFSTLGCPEWSWEDIVATAKDFGYDGIEVRGIENELYVPKAKPFLSNRLENTKNHLASIGLSIPCITSACYLHEDGEDSSCIKDAKEYIDLAANLGAPYVRVLGDTDPQPGESVDIDKVIDGLNVIGQYALTKNVMILIETNGVFANSDTMINVMQRVDNAGVGVLWDIHHPYRYMNESIGKTYQTLKTYIKHIHIKDSIVENGSIKYKMMGQGDMPINECLALLKRDGYSGYVSLEWVKRWYRDLEEPGIVFMQFENYIRDLWEQI